MSADRNVTRAVRSWLHEDRHEDADRVLDLVLDQLDVTQQRRPPWSARRLHSMSSNVRLALAAAVVVAIAVVGASILLRSPQVGPSGPTPTATPDSSPAASYSALYDGVMVTLRPGTYLLDDPFVIPLTFTVPAGWLQWHRDFLTAGILVDTGAAEGSGWGLFFLSPGDKLYADPCDKTAGMVDPVPGATVDDLVTALSDLPGMTASAPTDIEVDGYPGKLMELTAPADTASCSEGEATLWDFPEDDYPMALGERLPIRIVDVDGARLVIVATEYAATSAWETSQGVAFDPDAHAADLVELQAILESIQIKP